MYCTLLIFLFQVFFLIYLLHAVANAAKRIFVIIFSLVTLKNPVTTVNMFGMGVSVCGVWVYNRAKIMDQNNRKKKLQYALPEEAENQNENSAAATAAIV